MRDSGLIGRRRPDGTRPIDLEPGDYAKQAGGYWLLRNPNAQLGTLGGKKSPHEVTENIDGTITVSPGIQEDKTGWDGGLIRGVWRERSVHTAVGDVAGIKVMTIPVGTP